MLTLAYYSILLFSNMVKYLNTHYEVNETYKLISSETGVYIMHQLLSCSLLRNDCSSLIWDDYICNKLGMINTYAPARGVLNVTLTLVWF